MDKKYKTYLKLNIMSIFFIAVSFVSITLAWFAYSGLGKVSTDIDVKAWYIEFEKNNEAVSNDIVISLADIYPGMEPINESVAIKNLGDSDAQISYSISSARILDESLDTVTDLEKVEDELAHNYPFHINIELDKKYALAKDGVSKLNFSVSWPLDSGDDETDSEWGAKAYEFQKKEKEKYDADNNYEIEASLKVVINVKAEQFITDNDSIDINYNLGDTILYDVSLNKRCTELSDTCIKTSVLDIDNKIGDSEVELIPALYRNYGTGTYDEYNSLLSNEISSWNVSTRPLTAEDLLKIVSTDVVNTKTVREGLSDAILGNLKYDTRVNTEMQRVVPYNGYFKFLNDRFSFLNSSKCFWLNSEYDSSRSYALKKMDDTNSIIYGEDKTTACSVIPVIIASKSNLEI